MPRTIEVHGLPPDEPEKETVESVALAALHAISEDPMLRASQRQGAGEYLRRLRCAVRREAAAELGAEDEDE